MNRITLRKHLSAMVGVAALALASSVLSAAVILPYDSGGFESETLGNAALNKPAGWEAPTQPNVSGAIAIVAGSSTNGSGVNSKVLEFNGSASAFWADSAKFAEVIDQTLTIEFKVKLATGTNLTDFKFQGEGTGGQITSYVRLQAGALKFSYYDGSFHDVLTGVVKGNWYSVKQTLDLANKKFDITIDNLDSALPAQHVSLTGLNFSTLSANKMNRWYISRVSGDSANFQVDDVKIAIIPEPATLGLLALGGLIMATRKCR